MHRSTKIIVILFTLAAAFCGTAMIVHGQIPAPQINLSGNVGCQGFPCLNSGTIIFTSDANHTLTAQESSATGGIKITSGVSLTATRNLVLPTAFGKLQFVSIENATTGGQSIQVIGQSGTGITIPNGQSATSVWFDGTNVTGALAGGGGSSVGAQGEIQVVGSAPGSFAPNSVANSIPTFIGNASNYSYVNSNSLYTGYSMPCFETQLTGNTNDSGSACIGMSDLDYSPGQNWGNPGQGVSSGDKGHETFSVFPSVSYRAGNGQGIGFYTNQYKVGEFQLLNFAQFQKGGLIGGSAEAIAGSRWTFADEGDSAFNIASIVGNHLNLTCVSTCASISTLTQLFDVTTATTDTMTWVSGGGTGGVATMTLGTTTVATSSTGTLASIISVPPLVNNTTGKLASAVVTINYTVTNAIPITTTAQCMLGSNGTFSERFVPSAVGSLSGGVQSVTATYYNSHAVGETFYCGGSAGMMVQNPNDTQPHNNYLSNIYGSTAPHTVYVGHPVPNGVASIYQGAMTIPVELYKAVDIVGVIDSNTGVPDGGQLTVSETVGLTVGDEVVDPGILSSAYIVHFEGSDGLGINNPYASRVWNFVSWAGLGGSSAFPGGPASNGFTYFINPNPYSNYAGTGGNRNPPFLFNVTGATANGITFQYSPAYGGGGVLGNGNGYWFSAGGTAPGATSPLEGFWRPDINSQGSEFDYNHSTQTFILTASGGVLMPEGGVSAPYYASLSDFGNVTIDPPDSGVGGNLGFAANNGGTQTYISLFDTGATGSNVQPNYLCVGNLANVGGSYRSCGYSMLMNNLGVGGSLGIGYNPIWPYAFSPPYPLSVTGESGFACTGLSCLATLDASGHLTVTGCTGCGGGISGTAGYLTQFTSPTTAGNSPIDNGVTTSGALTSTEAINIGGSGPTGGPYAFNTIGTSLNSFFESAWPSFGFGWTEGLSCSGTEVTSDFHFCEIAHGGASWNDWFDINGLTGGVTMQNATGTTITATVRTNIGPVAGVTAQVISALPGTATLYDQRFVSDGQSVSDCTSGSGSAAHWCTWNGSAWVTTSNIVGINQISLGTGTLAPGACLTASAGGFPNGTSTSAVTATLAGPASLVSGALNSSIVLTPEWATDTKAVYVQTCNNSLSTWTYTGLSINVKVQ